MLELNSSRGVVTISKEGTHLIYNIPPLMDGRSFKYFKEKNKAVIKSYKNSNLEEFLNKELYD